MFDRILNGASALLGIALCLFTLWEVNFPNLQVQSAYAIFVMLGMVLCFLQFPIHRRLQDVKSLKVLDVLLALATVVCCGFVVVQSEEFFQQYWLNGLRLGDRAGAETRMDFVVGITGLVLVLEATRRSIGWIVPALALAFVLHSYYCYISNVGQWPPLPDALLPHAGQNLKDIASTTFLQSTGVFGVAASVMFKYVFLFVIFGAFLEISGATQFIIDFSERVFGQSPGGPAKVSVLGSGLMGSLSGSAVANAVTTGAFTIPMMRSAGFERHTAGGITAAAASGGALVPPVMGAGAYMMLELVSPQVTFLQIAKAAVIPAVLYYFSLWMIVHFYSRRLGTGTAQVTGKQQQRSISSFDGLVFFAALATLVGLLLLNFTPFKAVTGSLVVILVLTTFRRQVSPGENMPLGARIGALVAFAVAMAGNVVYQMRVEKAFANVENGWQVFGILLDASFIGMFALIFFGLAHPAWRSAIVKALTKSSKNGISLVAASACVGIIIGIVGQTGVANDFTAVIKGVVEENLFVALLGIMCCSIVLGMGVPSVVCYLLMATLMGDLLGDLGVIPLAAHMFIFYFGMMSMVTPPVALAAYASASIAESPIMRTALAAFRFSLVGFTLPYMFVYRPSLLLMNNADWQAWIDAVSNGAGNAGQLLDVANGSWPNPVNLTIAVAAAGVGIVALAAGIAGYLRSTLSPITRVVILLAAAMLLAPGITVMQRNIGLWVNIAGGILFVVCLLIPPRSDRSVGSD